MQKARINRIAVYAAVFTLFILESTIFNRLRILNAGPQLLLVATIFFGFHFGRGRGSEIGAFSGLLRDIFTIGGFGVNTFLFLSVGFLAGSLREKLSKDSIAVQFLFSNACVYFISGIYFLYLALAVKTDIGRGFWPVSFSRGLYTGCIAPLLFFILGKIVSPKTA